MRSEWERADGHGVLRVRAREAGRASGVVGQGAKLGHARCGPVRAGVGQATGIGRRGRLAREKERRKGLG